MLEYNIYVYYCGIAVYFSIGVEEILNRNNEINLAEGRKKHTLRNVILISLAVLILALGIMAVAFRRYINIISAGISKSEEQIHSMQADNDKHAHEILNELVAVTMRDLTDEERQMLLNGEITPEEALILIKGGTLDVVVTTGQEPTDIAEPVVAQTSAVVTTVTEKIEAPVEETVEKVVVTTAVKPQTTTASTKPNEKDRENEKILRARIEEIIAEIYLLRANYLNAIDKTIEQARREYMALPKDRHTLQGKMQFVTTVLVPRGNALESECDAEIERLLLELKGVLSDLGESTALVDEIKKVYKEQKDLKLTELTNQYSSKLK